MTFLAKGAWKPIGIPSLEPAAEEVVKSSTNRAVIAGPGAGKTELLAQRVCFLLQTNSCPRPRRIVAISFKRDAAKNLQDRVYARCGVDLSNRFDSYTFDAFAKTLLDRFRLALPKEWRPNGEYDIEDFYEKHAEDYLQSVAPPVHLTNYPPLRTYSGKGFLEKYFYSKPIELLPKAPTTAVEWAALNLWQELLHGQKASKLTFPMIGRLSELLLRCNPYILRALRATYTHVLLDEYQDTTNIQFDLVRTSFQGSRAILTAVGDDKQRIMGWAMALPNAFTPFLNEFSASLSRLEMNYRSAPELVRIQSQLILALDPQSVTPTAAIGGVGSCRVLVFPDYETEAETIAREIKALLAMESIGPRDVCILVKQLVDSYAPPIISALQREGINARVETALQDLLSEPIVNLSLSLFQLVASNTRGSHWSETISAIFPFRGAPSNGASLRKFEREVGAFKSTSGSILADVAAVEQLTEFLQSLVEFIGLDSVRNTYPQYQDERFAISLLEEASKFLWSYYEEHLNWTSAITRFLGADSVPIMTIHKSKGLEFHTVVFLGLEDSAFWKFRSQSSEDKCAFFVAFSRAKRRVIFTFSESRLIKKNRGVESQSRNNIGELYSLLRQCGVVEERIESKRSAD